MMCASPSPHTRATEYTLGRPPYPNRMFELIRDVIGVNAKVLDIGCGNGRSTIPLFDHCTTHVTAFDDNQDMLAELKKQAGDREISCTLGKVKDLQEYFKDKHFQAVVAFSALSLFHDEESLRAIRSVIVPGGVFIDAGDEGVKKDPIGQLMRDIIKEAIDVDVSLGSESDEQTAVTRNGFVHINTYEIPTQVEYNFDRTLANFRSRISYKYTNEQDEKIKELLLKHFNRERNGTPITFEVNYRIIVYKPQ